ncbi:DUF2797 domain-containing protein [Natronomonas sp. EA1]|uniref:DUF2797 domain-containing protein n=1 Tax=Natronomonas sp. EA1 TaxID=3421655 RepID=UPI003EB6FC5A
MQVVGYDAAPDPALYLASDGDVTHEPLESGRELSYSLGSRRCAGTVTDAGHRACEHDRAPYCDQHSSVWVCAKCTGTCLKDEMDCVEEHAIYLAAFAPALWKVGVTRAWRLETRLREQGAQRAAHLRTVKDGRIARELEAELAAEHDIVDRVRVPDKLPGLAREVDAEAWEAFYTQFDPVDTFAFDYGLDLTSQPVPETIAAGTVAGVQGRVLVLEREGTSYAVDLRDLVGYELTEGGETQDLQSSLGAWG